MRDVLHRVRRAGDHRHVAEALYRVGDIYPEYALQLAERQTHEQSNPTSFKVTPLHALSVRCSTTKNVNGSDSL